MEHCLTLLLDRFIPQVLSTNAPHMYDFILTNYILRNIGFEKGYETLLDSLARSFLPAGP